MVRIIHSGHFGVKPHIKKNSKSLEKSRIMVYYNKKLDAFRKAKNGG